MFKRRKKERKVQCNCVESINKITSKTLNNNINYYLCVWLEKYTVKFAIGKYRFVCLFSLRLWPSLSLAHSRGNFLSLLPSHSLRFAHQKIYGLTWKIELEKTSNPWNVHVSMKFTGRMFMGEVKIGKRMQQGKITKKLHDCLRRNYNISHFYGVLYVVDSSLSYYNHCIALFSLLVFLFHPCTWVVFRCNYKTNNNTKNSRFVSVIWHTKFITKHSNAFEWECCCFFSGAVFFTQFFFHVASCNFYSI